MLRQRVAGACCGSKLPRVYRPLQNAGINITKYGAHSTQTAATSAVKVANKSVKTIMDAARWANAGIFSKFYDKEGEYEVIEILKI